MCEALGAPTRAHQEEIDYRRELCSDDPTDPIHKVARWSLRQVPIAGFCCTFDRSELGRWWNAADEDARDAEIMAWVDAVGSWDDALRQSPIIAIRLGDKYDKVDGWHRMRLARAAGLTHVWCLVGALEERGDEH